MTFRTGLLLFVLMTIGGAALHAHAHEKKAVGPYTVVLHSEPGDILAGDPVQVYFFITDTQKKFSAAQCDCALQVSRGDDTIVEKSLTGLDPKLFEAEALMANLVYPARGTYTLSLHIASRDGSFETATASYSLSIQKENTAVKRVRMEKDGLIILVAGILMGMVVFITFKYRNKK